MVANIIPNPQLHNIIANAKRYTVRVKYLDFDWRKRSYGRPP